MNLDVQIYLKNLRNYIEQSDKASILFLGGKLDSIDDFMYEVEKVSTKNQELNGEPALTQEQFEVIRSKFDKKKINPQFFQLDGFPPISLN